MFHMLYSVENEEQCKKHLYNQSNHTTEIKAPEVTMYYHQSTPICGSGAKGKGSLDA